MYTIGLEVIGPHLKPNLPSNMFGPAALPAVCSLQCLPRVGQSVRVRPQAGEEDTQDTRLSQYRNKIQMKSKIQKPSVYLLSLRLIQTSFKILRRRGRATKRNELHDRIKYFNAGPSAFVFITDDGESSTSDASILS